MSKTDETEDFSSIFDAARVQAYFRIQEMDEAVELSAIRAIAKIVRPLPEKRRNDSAATRSTTNNPMHVRTENELDTSG